MRNLLILLWMFIGGILLVYAPDLLAILLTVILAVGCWWTTIKIKPKVKILLVVGLVMGGILSVNYQALSIDNKYYVNAIFYRRVGITDQYLYHNRILEVKEYDDRVQDEMLSSLIPGIKVKMTGGFQKTPYSLNGTLFQGKGVDIKLNPKATLRQKLENWKMDMTQRMKIAFGSEKGALAASLVLGVRDNLLGERRNTLKYLGILHILSISGFHVNLLEMMLERIGLKKGRVLIITVYAILIDSVSGWRACSMRLVKVIANFFHRDCDAFSQLLLSALIHLAVRPYLLFTASFQLTYLATLGLILFAKPLREKTISFPQNKCKEGIILSSSAMIPCLPVLSNMSFDVNLALFPANLMIVPLYSMFCMLSFLSLPILMVHLDWPLQIFGVAMNFTLKGIYFFEYILAEYFSMRIAWSGILIFLWLPVFYYILKKYSLSPIRKISSVMIFYALLFHLAFLPGTTRIIFHKQMGQARVVIQNNLRQYEFVTIKMYKPSIRQWAVPVATPRLAGDVIVKPGTIFPKVMVKDYEIRPKSDVSSDIINEEYLLIDGKLIRLK